MTPKHLLTAKSTGLSGDLQEAAMKCSLGVALCILGKGCCNWKGMAGMDWKNFLDHPAK